VLLALCAAPVSAAPAANSSLTALFPFVPLEDDPSPLERIASDLLAAQLAEAGAVRLVDRKRLASVAAGLDLVPARGLGDADARRIASLAGAKIAITARTARIEGQLILYVRIMGVSGTGVVEEYTSGSSAGAVRPLCLKLSDAITAAVLQRSGEILSGAGGPEERLALLRERLAGRRLPKTHVVVVESYGGSQRDASAAGEELTRILREFGFTMVNTRDEADIVVYGSASGETAPRRGELVASEVRVEMRAVDPSGGKLLAVASSRHTAVDLFASLAGKKAFREAVLLLAPEFIEETLRAWEASDKTVPAFPYPSTPGREY
jgi:hypothetical protein